jgi:hypothetical protein
MRGRLKGQLGHILAARPSGENSPRARGNARAGRARSVITARSSCARWRDDAIDGGTVGAGRRQGAVGEHR